MKSHSGRRLLSAVLALLTRFPFLPSLQPQYRTERTQTTAYRRPATQQRPASYPHQVTAPFHSTTGGGSIWATSAMRRTPHMTTQAGHSYRFRTITVFRRTSLPQVKRKAAFFPAERMVPQKLYPSRKLAGKEIVLNFDGVYSDAYVYINGVKLGEHHYGYTSFAFDLTDYLTW